MKKKLRIVVADDSDILRASLSAFLRRMAEVTLVGGAVNGEEALRCVDELDPDLLVLDIQMPKLDGWQVLRRLHDQTVRVKIIVFSTHPRSWYGRRGDHHNVIAYLTKENPQALANAIIGLANNPDAARFSLPL